MFTEITWTVSYVLLMFRIDATETDRLGRFVNDAPRSSSLCNSNAKSVFLLGKPRVLIFASKNIQAGTELRYDYGGKDYAWRQVCFCCKCIKS